MGWTGSRSRWDGDRKCGKGTLVGECYLYFIWLNKFIKEWLLLMLLSLCSSAQKCYDLVIHLGAFIYTTGPVFSPNCNILQRPAHR